MTDMLFRNGIIFGAGEPLESGCVAIEGNRIKAVGGDELLDLITPSTAVVDLEGRTLLPGVNDGHLHIGGFGLSRPPAALDVSPGACATVRSIVDALATQTTLNDPGTWIRGRGWAGASLADLPGTEPWAGLIDEVTPHHPVVLADFSGHAVWVNSAAMREANLTADSKVPTGGVARRTPDGDFTGLFIDAAQAMITNHMPAPTDDELEAAVRAGIAELHRNGITSMTDAALNPLPGNEDLLGGSRVFDVLQRICGRHDVPMRTNVLVTFSSLGASMLEPTVAGLDMWQAPESDPAWFGVRGLKIFADGVPPSCTAWVSHAYPDGSHGCLTVGGDTDEDRAEELALLIRAGHDRGMQVGVHATGDRTVDAVLDGFEAVSIGSGSGGAKRSGATMKGSRGISTGSVERGRATGSVERGRATGSRSGGAKRSGATMNSWRGISTGSVERGRAPRHYIIHGPLATSSMLERAGRLGVGFNVQPSLKSTSARAIEALFGRELSEWQWPLRSMIDTAGVLAASSDAPVCEPNWRHGVAGAVLRETDDGEVYGADQRIRVEEAVDAYTRAGAWQDGAEDWKGSIAPGMVADICVVDARLSTDDPRVFADADVSMTLVDGVVVHG